MTAVTRSKSATGWPVTRAGTQDAGVGDEEVEAAVALHDGAHGGSHGGIVRDVHGHRPGAPRAELGLDLAALLGGAVGIDVGEDDMTAGGGEAAGDLEAEALGSAGDERDAPAEAPRVTPEGRRTAPVRLDLPGLDEAALGVREGAHPAEGVGALGDAHGVEVDVPGRVRFLPRLARGEDAQARHDRDDRRNASLCDESIEVGTQPRGTSSLVTPSGGSKSSGNEPA